MLQNPAGERPQTPTDNLLESIRDALAGLRGLSGSGATDTSVSISIQLGPIFYVGSDFRITGIPGGAFAEARDPATDTWAEIDRWTNP